MCKIDGEEIPFSELRLNKLNALLMLEPLLSSSSLAASRTWPDRLAKDVAEQLAHAIALTAGDELDGLLSRHIWRETHNLQLPQKG